MTIRIQLLLEYEVNFTLGSLNTNQLSDSPCECDLEESDADGELRSLQQIRHQQGQFNVASVQRTPLTQGWRTLAAPEGQTGSPGGNGS